MFVKLLYSYTSKQILHYVQLGAYTWSSAEFQLVVWYVMETSTHNGESAVDLEAKGLLIILQEMVLYIYRYSNV